MIYRSSLNKLIKTRQYIKKHLNPNNLNNNNIKHKILKIKSKLK